MVFLHGLTYDRRMWGPVIERLSDGYTCVNIDLPGHGESAEAESYDLAAVAHGVHKLVERLALGRPILIGHSIGGLIATLHAGTYPTAGLVTSGQTLRTTPFIERVQRMGDALRSPAFPEIWRAIERELGIDLIPEPRRALIEKGSNPRQEIVLGYWREPLDVPPAELQRRLDLAVQGIEAPFTAIFGNHVAPDYRAWARAILGPLAPQCDVVVFPDAGHFPHLVDPDRFAGEVRALARRTVGAMIP